MEKVFYHRKNYTLFTPLTSQFLEMCVFLPFSYFSVDQEIYMESVLSHKRDKQQ